MKGALVLNLVCGLVFFLPIVADEPAPHQREWLEDVSPIITGTEREVFSRLKTNEERDKFIRLFWRQRDPLPDTAENEFYKAYLERIRFADQYFGHGTSKRGSQTERGYFYLLLGPPLERTFYTTQSQIWPLELWFYKGEVEYGLPPYFYLIFYQPQGLGEYRLYSPGVEGPEKLVIATMAPRSLTRAKANEIIKQVNAELAAAALSYLPGDQTLLAPTVSSTSVLASIRSFPEKKFTDAYARNYLGYKDYVETEYSHNFIDSSFMAKIFRHDDRFFLHWSLEPKKMNFAARGESYQAVYNLILRLEDREGGLILEKEEEIPLAVTPAQYKEHERQRFAFQDVLPVIPGRFRLFGLLKNKTAQDFTSFSTEFIVPEENETPRSSGLILYHSRENTSPAQSQMLRAFTFGGRHFLVNTENEFLPQGAMGAYLRVYDQKVMNVDSQAAARLEIRQADQESATLSHQTALAEVRTAEGEGIDTGPFSLASLEPGYYTAEFSLVDGNGQKLLTAKENFVVLSQVLAVLPWVYSRAHRPAPNPEQLILFGTEYFMAKRYEEAVRLADQAVKIKDEPAARILLAKALYGQGRFKESLAAALPAHEPAKSRDAAKVIAADYVGLQDWTSALVYLERLMAEATEVSVLNLAGECYLNTNQPERALSLLRKSLEIEPNQPAVRALVEKAEKGREERDP